MQRCDSDKKQQGYDARKNMRQEKESTRLGIQQGNSNSARTAMETMTERADRNRTGLAMMQR